MPWGKFTQDKFDLKRAQKILNRDHFWLEKVKERIIEHLAVLKLTKSTLKMISFSFFDFEKLKKNFFFKSEYVHKMSKMYFRIVL